MTDKTINYKPSNPNSGSKPKPKGLKNLLLSAQSMITQVFGGWKWVMKQSSGSERLNIVSSIKQLPVSQFLQAVCYDDYTGVEDFNLIMSQYYIAKKDKHAVEFISLVSKMKLIEFKAQRLDFLCNCLSATYNPEIADILKAEYPQATFSEATFMQDMIFVGNLERNNKVEYEDLSKQLDAINKPSKGKELSADEKYDGFMNLIYDINKFLQHQAITMQSNTYEFAVATHKLEKYIESLQTK